MKKIVFALIGAPTATVATAAIIIAPLATSITHQQQAIFSYARFVNNQQFAATPFVLPPTANDIFTVNNEADINLYYTAAGTATYTNMLRLAMLANAAKKEVHFAYAPDSYEHQAKTNADYFTQFLHTGNKASTIVNMHNDSSGQVTALWKRIITSNPHRKINIWWNSDHLNHWNGAVNNKILELAGYGNVNLQLIEDGSSIGQTASKAFANAQVVKHFQTPQTMAGIDAQTQYLAQNAFTNVYSWFSAANVFTPYLGRPEFKNLRTFDQKALADAIFNTRLVLTDDQAHTLLGPDVQNAPSGLRMHSFYPYITGLDWRDALNMFNKAQADRPGKGSLILLGSYGVDGEDKYIRQVWEKYHDRYNIFYKGHPGHSEHSSYVQDALIPSEAKEGMYVLDSAIASEELTRDHLADGLRFDKVISVGQTSAMDGFPALDLRTDYLEQYNGVMDAKGNPVPLINGQTGWKTVTDWLTLQGWIK